MVLTVFISLFWKIWPGDLVVDTAWSIVKRSVEITSKHMFRLKWWPLKYSTCFFITCPVTNYDPYIKSLEASRHIFWPSFMMSEWIICSGDLVFDLRQPIYINILTKFYYLWMKNAISRHFHKICLFSVLLIEHLAPNNPYTNCI